MRGIAWSTPAIAAAGAAPAFAASSICTPAGAPATVDWQRTAFPTGYCSGTQGGQPIYLLTAGQTYTWTYTLTVTGATIQTGVVGMRIFPYYPAKQITGDGIKRYQAWQSVTVTSSHPTIFSVGAPVPRTESVSQPEVFGLTFPITQIAAAPVGVYTFTLSITVPFINPTPQFLSGAIMPSDMFFVKNCAQVVTRTSDQNDQFTTGLWAPEGAENSATEDPWCP